MLLNRSARAFRLLTSAQKARTALKQSVRNGHGVIGYRTVPDPPRRMVIGAEIVQGFAWWWVLWHLWTEPEHLIGEFDYPDPTKWTDEELGIPESLDEEYL